MTDHSAIVRFARYSVAAAAAVTLAVGLSACAGEEPKTPSSTATSSVDKAFESDDGLAVSVSSRICGISAVGTDKPEFTAAGQYCTVGVTVTNETGEEVDVSMLKLTGHADGNEYFPDYWAGAAADGGMQALASGETVDSTLFFDMPKGALLETVSMTSPWPGLEAFEVAF